MRPRDHIALDRAIRYGGRRDVLERAAGRRGGQRFGRRGGGGAPGEITKSASQAVSTSNYFLGNVNEGTGALGTIRFTMRVIAVPDGTFRVIAANFGGGGWYLSSANPTAGAIFLTCYLAGGTSKVSAGIQIVAADVGKTIVVHATADSSFLRVFLNGCEQGTGVSTGLAPAAPAAGDALYIGKYSGGSPSGDFALMDLSYSPTVLTPAQIDADAASIMGRRAKLAFPTMPGTTKQWNAIEYSGGANWAPRVGTGTLAKNGTIASNTESSISWVRNLGRIMWCGDSQVSDGFYTIKAAEWNALTQYFIANAIRYVLVGPATAGWNGGPNALVSPAHRGASGETAANADTGTLWSSTTFAGFHTTYRPRISMVAFGTNDLGADLVSPATVRTRMETLFTAARSTAPWVHLLTRSLPVPHGPMYLASAADFTAYNAAGPAWAAANGVGYVDIGDPDRDGTDGLHILDGATGYGTYSAPDVSGVASPTLAALMAHAWGA